MLKNRFGLVVRRRSKIKCRKQKGFEENYYWASRAYNFLIIGPRNYILKLVSGKFNKIYKDYDLIIFYKK